MEPRGGVTENEQNPTKSFLICTYRTVLGCTIINRMQCSTFTYNVMHRRVRSYLYCVSVLCFLRVCVFNVSPPARVRKGTVLTRHAGVNNPAGIITRPYIKIITTQYMTLHGTLFPHSTCYVTWLINNYVTLCGVPVTCVTSPDFVGTVCPHP